MGTPTSAWGSLATSQQIQYAIPYIDASSLQPTLDAGTLAGIPSGGGLVYVPEVEGGALSGIGSLQVGNAGDLTPTDPIAAGAQVDSYMPTTLQNTGVVGKVPGHTVSSSRGSRYVPLVSQDGDLLGEFAGYGLVNIAGVASYQKLVGISYYVQGADANYPGGRLRIGTRANAGGAFTEWVGINNAGQIGLKGPLQLATPTLAFQGATSLYAGTGVADNAYGNNGDFYLRSDGGAGTCIYQKRAGAWVATGA